MPLLSAAGLGPGNILLDEDPAPLPKKGGRVSHQFLAHFYCGRTAGWIKMPLCTEVGLGPGDIVLDEDPAHPHPKKGTAPPPNFWPMSIMAKRLYMSGYLFVRR